MLELIIQAAIMSLGTSCFARQVESFTSVMNWVHTLPLGGGR